MSLAKKIRAQRQALGLHQYQLATKLSVSQSTVADWENGHQKPRPKNLRKVARILKLDFEELRATYEAELFA